MITRDFVTRTINGREWPDMEYGTLLAVNINGIECNPDIFGKRLRFEHIAKSGLVVVFLDGDTRKKFSIPRLELDLIVGDWN